MKNKKRYSIGLDLGTSSIKGVMVDAAGKIIAERERNVSFIYPATDWIELDPEQHYRDVCWVISQLTATIDCPVSGIAMAAASGNTLLTDADGEPLTNIISWLDKRAQDILPELLKSFTIAQVRAITGWPCIDSFPLAHLAWFREQQPELYFKAAHYAMNSDWLIYKLTGKWRMDYSTATTFHLLDQSSMKYHKPFLEILEIDEERLSPLTDSGVAVGNVTVKAATDCGLSSETVVMTGSFDHPAAARGMGITTPGELMLSCGTSWVGFFPETEREKIIELELLCDPFLSTNGGAWGAIFSVPQIGRTIDWYVDNLIAPEAENRFAVFDELAAQSTPDADGLIIDIEQPPRKIADSKANISRAVMNGAARALKGRLNMLSKNGINFAKAVMVGGPAKSPIWPEIVENITGLKISIGSQYAGAYGAAQQAGEK